MNKDFHGLEIFRENCFESNEVPWTFPGNFLDIWSIFAIHFFPFCVWNLASFPPFSITSWVLTYCQCYLHECAVTMYSNLGFFASNLVNHSFAGYQKLIALSKLDRLVSLFKSQNPKINNGHAMLMRLLLQYFTVLLRQENNFFFCTCNDYQSCQCYYKNGKRYTV